jgi:type III restriction enzyme
MPDFIVRLGGEAGILLILETKGFDPLAEIKVAAAQRWVAAVNADGQHGRWVYAMVRRIGDIGAILAGAAAPLG